MTMAREACDDCIVLFAGAIPALYHFLRSFMSEIKDPSWVLNELSQSQVFDGEAFLVAIKVMSTLDKEYWEYEKIRINCGENFFNIYYYDCFNEIYDGWSWEDFEFYIRIKS